MDTLWIIVYRLWELYRRVNLIENINDVVSFYIILFDTDICIYAKVNCCKQEYLMYIVYQQ